MIHRNSEPVFYRSAFRSQQAVSGGQGLPEQQALSGQQVGSELHSVPGRRIVFYRRLYIGALLIALLMMLGACSPGSDHISQALESVRAGEWEQAGELLDEAQEAGEDGELLARARGILAMSRGSYEDAVGYFRDALSLAGTRAGDTEFDISFYLMSAQEKLGRINEAIETCSAILGLRPFDSETWFLRGRLNIENDSYEEGIRDFNRAVDTYGKDGPDMYIRIYEFLMQKGYSDAAEDYLARAGNASGRFTDLQKGALAYCKGDYESARDFLEKARSSSDEGVILYLGRTYEALEDYGFAASLYKSYIEKHPEDMTIQNQYGMCLMTLEKYDEALEVFEKALEDGGGDMRENLSYNRIVACERLGDFERATSLIKEYVKDNPGDEDAAREAEFLTQWERMGE